MNAHTPGPWRMSETTRRDDLASRQIYGGPEGMLAIVREEHQGGHYGPANALLITAAPDMLEALRFINERLCEARILPSYAAMDSYEWCISECRRAIAKATYQPPPGRRPMGNDGDEGNSE